MDEYKSIKRFKEKNKNISKNNNKFLVSIINKVLISVILLLICLCSIKINPSLKEWINKNVYETNISFAKINKTYEKYFGTIFPIDKIIDKTTPVFDEHLVYEKEEPFNEGVKLTVENNYLVPILESGIVVFIGNKDNYGNTIIIQQVNGVDLWYVGVENTNIKLYDYVEKGSLLGEATSNEIYLYYQKSGEFLDYKEYIS